jgi:uncharacterized Zn finger protein (UPF0148 family)
VRGRNAPPPSDLEIKTKKPAADVFRAGEPTRLDDVILPVFCPTCQNLVELKSPPQIAPRGLNKTSFDDAILPVFCPTCQTNEFAKAALGDQEDRQMTRNTTSQQTSRYLPGQKPRIDKERNTREAIAEDAGETEDKGRDLVHGDGGTIDLPTKPGDLSKDD